MRLIGLLLSLLAISGCNEDRLKKMEQQTAALRQQVDAIQKGTQLDLQARCAKDAREWFQREWREDKDTTLLTFENHYSSRVNKCFITVNFNYRLDSKSDSFQKTINIFDVYENTKLAEYSEIHGFIIPDRPKVVMGLCEVQGAKCSSIEDFDKRLVAFQ